MKLNEDIEENDKSEKNLIKILQEIEENIKNIISELSVAFKSRNSIKAKELLTEMKFYNSAVLKLKERLQK